MTRASRTETAVWLLALVLGAAAAVAWWRVGLGDVLPTGTGWLVVGALVVAFALAERYDVRVEVRGELQTVNLSGSVLVIGLAFIDPGQLLIARLLGLAAVLVPDRVAPNKIAFNLTTVAFDTALAVAVFAAVAQGAPVVTPQGWLAALAAVAVASLVSFGAVTLALAILVGSVQVTAWTFQLILATVVSTTVLGLITAYIIEVDWRGLWLALALFAALAAAHAVYGRLRRKYADLEVLHRFMAGLSGATEADDVTRRVLDIGHDLLRAEVVELLLVVPDGLLVKRLDADGVVTEPWRPTTDGSVETALAGPGRSLLLPRTADGSLVAGGRWRDVVAAPLRVEGQLAGLLLAANRHEHGATFDEDDRRLLEAFADHTAIALRVGELVSRLRADAIEKEFQATHDELTGLPNRAVVTERVERLLPEATPTSAVAVYFCDLDGFKEVNDALGHHTGDQLLVEIAARLARAVGRRGTVGRFGGDEFVLVLHDVETTVEATLVGEWLRSVVEEPIEIDDLVLQVGVSIGVALGPIDGLAAEALFQHADVAMYVAKGRRSGVELYDPNLDNSSPRRLRLAADLRRAIEHGELTLHYQPQVDLATGKVVGLEALTRWAHPDYGTVPPDEFIPIAEQSGLIRPLTRWALRTALEDLARWQVTRPELGVSVNLSMRNLLDATLVQMVADLEATSLVPAHCLTLELVESSVMADPERSMSVLRQLDAMGCGLAIDDFGTGYSSLSYLKRLPVDEVKIDKSFVMQMASDPDDSVIVRCTIDLARNLGLRVVAEGVEDAETCELLRRLGCDRVQGYFLSRPVPAASVPALLDELEGVRPWARGVLASVPGERPAPAAA